MCFRNKQGTGREGEVSKVRQDWNDEISGGFVEIDWKRENSCVSTVVFLVKSFLNRFDTLAREVLWWSIVPLASINRNREKIPFHHKGKKKATLAGLTKIVVTITVLECTIKTFVSFKNALLYMVNHPSSFNLVSTMQYYQYI
jgi:hypothetical protein